MTMVKSVFCCPCPRGGLADLGCGGHAPRLDGSDGNTRDGDADGQLPADGQPPADGGTPDVGDGCHPQRTMKAIASDVAATAGFQADATSI